MWENVRFSMNSTMPLFFVMLLGYVLYQKKFLSDAFVAGANKFVFYVALPVQLFRDLAATDVRAAFDGAYVLFCFVVTLVSILGIWALAKLFLPDKRLVGEFVQVCYRSSAAILGTAFLQSIYGTAEMSSMMILGSVPLYNVMAVVILMLEGPEAAQAGSMTAKLKKSVKGILTNPTLLGIAAGFAGVTLGDGLLWRVLPFVVFEGIAIWYVSAYAARLKRDPSRAAVAYTNLTLPTKRIV